MILTKAWGKGTNQPTLKQEFVTGISLNLPITPYEALPLVMSHKISRLKFPML
jgi:hypothetical protein